MGQIEVHMSKWLTKKRAILDFTLICLITLVGTTHCSNSSTSAENSLGISDKYGLVYYSQRDNLNDTSMGGFGGLYLVDLNTGKEKLLTENSVVSQFEIFSWSPVIEKLVYTQRGEDITNESHLELFLLDLNGSKTKLTDNQVYDSDGRWRPDGKKIAFWSTRQIDESFLYLMNPDGSDVSPVFDHNYREIVAPDFSWSPDGNKLAISTVHSMTLAAENIQIVNINPLEILPLPLGSRIRTNFSWSNDSKKLVYLSDPTRQDVLGGVFTTMYVYNLERQEDDLLAEFSVIGTPVWSPTKDVIAFSAAQASTETDDLNIYLINGDGSDLKQLTNSGSYRVVSWSPDGNKLAVEIIGNQLSEHEIGVFDIRTETLKHVTDNDVFDAFPIWVEIP